MQDPLNASQRWFLHLSGHFCIQPGENLTASQPTNVNFKNQVLISTHTNALLSMSVDYAY